MICATCKAEGRLSRVQQHGPATTTLLNCSGYYDEQGQHHSHNTNINTASFRCSNGHAWTEKTSGSCWCGWKAGT